MYGHTILALSFTFIFYGMVKRTEYVLSLLPLLFIVSRDTCEEEEEEK